MNPETKRNKLFSAAILVISIITLSQILATNGSFFPSANGQATRCNNLDSKDTLPVLLVHGWNQGVGGSISNDWSEWAKRFNQENIPFCLVTFQQSHDACGSSSDHARELDQIVKSVRNETGQKQVNIVGYSKGGLDARVYLANNLTNDAVANLIMIGTPNAGSEWAIDSLTCRPAVFDMVPGSNATKAERNNHTEYHTIAGACFPLVGDGMVLISNVNSQPYFDSLGLSPKCHQNLLGEFEYGLVHDVLIGKK
jgi:pimeloyl-ACP methyl ester carboxylesterase